MAPPNPRSVVCANNSEEWLQRYTDPSITPQVVGMLFIFNHDDQYVYDLHQLMDTMDERNFDIGRNRRVFLIDPATISYLYTVATDITALRGRGEIPGKDACSFFYPDLVQVRARKSVGEAATLEILTGPWQILHYHRTANASSANSGPDAAGDGYLVYYRGKGDELRDFRYLIDHFFHYQMLGENSQIHLRMPFACREAPALFERAVDNYVDHYGMKELAARLNKIKFRTVQTIRSKFSDVELGMRNE